MFSGHAAVGGDALIPGVDDDGRTRTESGTRPSVDDDPIPPPEGDLIDSNAMSAGENTIEALTAYGLMEIVYKGRMFGRWVENAPEILKSL
jgi:hypothetical protein